MTEDTPERAFRQYVTYASGSIAAIAVGAILANTARVQSAAADGQDLIPTLVWTSVGTAAVILASYLLYAIPAAVFLRGVRRANPDSLVFVTRRTKPFESSVADVSHGKFNITYLSAVIADSTCLRIESRKTATLTIAWSRVLGIESSVSEDFRIDYPCIALDVRGDGGAVRMPLVASVGAWSSLTMTRPRLIRNLVDTLRDHRRIVAHPDVATGEVTANRDVSSTGVTMLPGPSARAYALATVTTWATTLAILIVWFVIVSLTGSGTKVVTVGVAFFGFGGAAALLLLYLNKKAAEAANGYTTATRLRQDLVQIDNVSGKVVRRAGEPFFTADEMRLAYRRARQ